jgi:hypothetical protein
MTRQTVTPGKAPIVWSTVEDAFEKINANFAEIYATILGENVIPAEDIVIGQQYTIVSAGNTPWTLIGSTNNNTGTVFTATGNGSGTGTARPKFNSVEFDNLETDLIPSQNDTYDLGAPNKRWASLYLSNTLSIGGAAITNQGLTVDLPSGTTVAGQLIIDPNKTFFKEFSVNGDTSIVAEQFNDVLDFQENTGINITTNSSSNAIIIENTGVTNLTAGTAMTVSSATGSVTVSNAGVTAITAGLGMSRNTATGVVTIANTGIVDVDAGLGISVGARDPVTGKVIVTNTLPAGNSYRIFATAGEPNLTARSTADTITLIEGAGINITNTVASGAFTNRITLENTGVLSLTAGVGLVVSAATGAVTVSFNNRIDIIGSVFADDSTMLVDGVSGRIVAPVFANVTGDVTGNVTGTLTGNSSGTHTGAVIGNVTGNLTGYQTGDMTGSVFGQDSTKLIDGVESKIVGPVETNSVVANSYIQTGVYADLTAISTALPTPAKGMIVFDDGTNQFRGFDGSSWVALN